MRGLNSLAEGSESGLEQGEELELEHREALRRLPDIRGGIDAAVAANWNDGTSLTLDRDSRYIVKGGVS